MAFSENLYTSRLAAQKDIHKHRMRANVTAAAAIAGFFGFGVGVFLGDQFHSNMYNSKSQPEATDNAVRSCIEGGRGFAGPIPDSNRDNIPEFLVCIGDKTYTFMSNHVNGNVTYVSREMIPK